MEIETAGSKTGTAMFLKLIKQFKPFQIMKKQCPNRKMSSSSQKQENIKQNDSY